MSWQSRLGGCAVALILTACSPPQVPALGAGPDEHESMTCEALSTERDRMLGERDELSKPQFSIRTDAERQSEVAQLNGKLYAVAKAQFDKGCPAVATAGNGRVVR